MTNPSLIYNVYRVGFVFHNSLDFDFTMLVSIMHQAIEISWLDSFRKSSITAGAIHSHIYMIKFNDWLEINNTACFAE